MIFKKIVFFLLEYSLLIEDDFVNPEFVHLLNDLLIPMHCSMSLLLYNDLMNHNSINIDVILKNKILVLLKIVFCVLPLRTCRR
jgi:hypothetical protein